MPSSARERTERIGSLLELLHAYFFGIVVGCLLWTPVAGVLSVAFAIGGLLVGLPILLFFGAVLWFAHDVIEKRPAFFSIVAAVACSLVYTLFDRAIAPNADLPNTALRIGLVATCAAVAAAIFYLAKLRKHRGIK